MISMMLRHRRPPFGLSVLEPDSWRCQNGRAVKGKGKRTEMKPTAGRGVGPDLGRLRRCWVMKSKPFQDMAQLTCTWSFPKNPGMSSEITPWILLWGGDWNPQSYSKEGGVLRVYVPLTAHLQNLRVAIAISSTSTLVYVQSFTRCLK